MGQVPIGDPEDILNATSAAAAAVLGLALYDNPNPAIGYNNMYAMIQLNCALTVMQSGIGPVTGRPTLFDGAEVLTAAADLGLFIEYPEDINVWGASFNTTFFGWGVQGDFTYRPDAPFQVDTDSLTIAGAMAACAFPAGVADLASTFEALGTIPGTTLFLGVGRLGTVRSPASSTTRCTPRQIGTTSTYTASDWWVDFIGADLGIIVSEAGMVYVPDVEDTWLDKYDPDGLGPASPTRHLQPVPKPRLSGFRSATWWFAWS